MSFTGSFSLTAEPASNPLRRDTAQEEDLAEFERQCAVSNKRGRVEEWAEQEPEPVAEEEEVDPRRRKAGKRLLPGGAERQPPRKMFDLLKRRAKEAAKAAEEDDDHPVRYSSQVVDDDDRACQIRPQRPGESLAIVQQYMQEREQRIGPPGSPQEAEPPPKPGDDVKAHKESRGLVAASFKKVSELEEEKLLLDRRGVLSADLCRECRRGAGDQRLDDVRRLLNSMGYTRSAKQKLFHDNFTMACLPLIYGSEWGACSERVLKEHKIDRIRPGQKRGRKNGIFVMMNH